VPVGFSNPTGLSESEDSPLTLQVAHRLRWEKPIKKGGTAKKFHPT